MSIDFREIPVDGEQWEMFARDFLQELGFKLESPPDRGPDGGKDMLFLEELQGKLTASGFRWLVSCKHNAHSGKAVSVEHELSMLERVQSFGADGFLGFYSTLPSSALNTRLRDLRDRKSLRDYRIFDSRLIENYLVRLGYSKLVLRYFPLSYVRLKPVHALLGEYEPLSCAHCERDLLEALHQEGYTAIVVLGRKFSADGKRYCVEDIAWVCKGQCDKAVSGQYRASGLSDGWKDISDLAIPVVFLKWVFGTMNLMRDGIVTFSDRGFEKHKQFISIMAQKVLRETTEAEQKRFMSLEEMPF